MTNEYALPYSDANVTIYGGTMSGSYAEPMSPLNFRTRPIQITNQTQEIKQAIKDGKIIAWEYTDDEARGPQVQKDKLERSYAGWSTSTSDRRFRGYKFNPTTTTRDSQSFGGTAGNGGVYWCDDGTTNQLVVAQGTTANRCLGTAFTTLSPSIQYKTYSPGSAISALMAGPIGGASSTHKVLIGRTSATIDVHTVLGTSDGTMHANLTFCCGGALSPVNASNPGTPTWIFYANAGLWTLPITAAITDAPTQVGFNLPNGGCVVENRFETLEKSPNGNRMYMLFPTMYNRTTTAWNGPGASPAPCRLVSCNEEGYDLQNHEIPLPAIYFACFWQRRLVLAGATGVVLFDGETAVDLNIFGALNGGSKGNIAGIGRTSTSLIVDVAIASGGTTTLQKWEYNEATHGWSPASSQSAVINAVSISDTSPYAMSNIATVFGPSMPYNRYTGELWRSVYNTSDVSWDFQRLPSRGVNPLLVGASLESSSVDTSPEWFLPGRLAGYPFVIEEIDARLCDIDNGGTNAKLKCEVACQDSNTALSFTNAITREFTKGEAIAGRFQKFPNNSSAVNRFQKRETLTSGTTSPNAANVIYRGIVFLDGVVRTPAQVRGTA